MFIKSLEQEQNSNRLQLIFLPPYSPKLNLIEGLSGWMKNEVINNAFFKTVNEIRVAFK